MISDGFGYRRPSSRWTHLGVGDQRIDFGAIKADDHLVADHDGGGAPALILFNQILQGGRILGDVTLDEVHTFLRKILFRRMARASAVGGEDLNRVFRHLRLPSFEDFQVDDAFTCV